MSSSCNRNSMTHKYEVFTIWPYTKRSLLTPRLEDGFWRSQLKVLPEQTPRQGNKVHISNHASGFLRLSKRGACDNQWLFSPSHQSCCLHHVLLCRLKVKGTGTNQIRVSILLLSVSGLDPDEHCIQSKSSNFPDFF